MLRIEGRALCMLGKLSHSSLISLLPNCASQVPTIGTYCPLKESSYCALHYFFFFPFLKDSLLSYFVSLLEGFYLLGQVCTVVLKVVQ